MDLQLQDRVAVVVGGTGLIGSAVATRLRHEGATVVVASRHAPDGWTLDARDDESVGAAVARIIRLHSRIDALVVTAAPSARTLDPAHDADPEQVIDAIDAKAMAFLRVANAVLPTMRAAAYGRVVVISGQNALVTGSITGSVRNAATILIAKNLADELAGTGVVVNAVNPGVVTEQPDPEVHAGRGGESSPQQIADLIAFLVSPISAVSGESIAIGHRVRGVTLL